VTPVREHYLSLCKAALNPVLWMQRHTKPQDERDPETPYPGFPALRQLPSGAHTAATKRWKIKQGNGRANGCRYGIKAW